MAKTKVCSVFLFGLILFSSCVLRTNASAEEDMADDEDKMGMEALYKMVHFFLGDIIQTKNISESFLNLTKGFDNFDQDKLKDWKEWMDYGKGYAAGVVIGLLFIVLMPIVGLFFCCCRLCGKCGGKPRKHDSRRSKCKRRTYCTLIVVFNTLALAGVVCSFMCSHLIYKALQNENNEGTIGHIQESLQSIMNFTDKAVDSVSDKVTKKFSEVSTEALNNINKTGSEAVDIVLEQLNATKHLNKAKSISENVNKTKEQLVDASRMLGQLTNETDQLKENLTNIQTAITEICQGGKCDIVPDEATNEANFGELKTMKGEADEVAKTMDMTQYVKEAEDEIQKAKANTKRDIEATLDKARKSLEDIEVKINDGIKDLRQKKDDAMSFYPSTSEDLEDIDDRIKDGYSDYVYYGCVGVSCVYLFIVVLYYLGIVFGLCGERPGHDAPCCNRGAGASFLMAGVGFTFIFSWILMLLCTIMFVVGGISYTEVCRYFHGHNPSNFKVFDETLNKGLDLSTTLFKDSDVHFSISQSIRDCQNNKALYSAFHMKNIVNLNEITDIKPLEDELDELKSTDLKINNITIMNDDLKTKLLEFSDAGLQNINFTLYFKELGKSLTKVDVSKFQKLVEDAAETQTDAETKKNLRKQADNLKELKSDVNDITLVVNDLKKTLEELQKGSEIAESIETLIAGLNASETEFNKNKESLVKEKINEVADKIVRHTNASIDDLINQNGLWFSFGWCLFFFVLCLIFGVLLAGEYRHECKYGKEFDDPLFDGRNHDMMPLTSHALVGSWNQHPTFRQSHSSYMDRPGYRGDPMRDHHGHHHHPPPHHGNLYQAPDGVHNSGFSPDMKHRPRLPPPPYGHHMQPGIAAYATSPPPEYNGHQHHDLASAYPAHNNRGGRSYLAAESSKNSYSYPY